jgi:hypothetical protein
MTDAERSQRVTRALKAGYRLMMHGKPERHYVARLVNGGPPIRITTDVASRSEARAALITLPLTDPSL